MRYLNKAFPRRLGLYTQHILKPVFKARGLTEGRILTHWPEIVGEKFARISLPEKITFPKGKRGEGTLHLSVTSSGSLLLHAVQDLILEKINTFFGYNAVTKLRMTHGLVPPKERPIEPAPVLSAKDKEWIRSQIQDVTDPDLKESLEKLGASVSLYSKKES